MWFRPSHLLFLVPSICLLFQVVVADSTDEEDSYIGADERWRHVGGGRLDSNGPVRPYDIVESGIGVIGTNAMKAIVRQYMANSRICKLSKTRRCALATKSPGTFGEVHYEFRDKVRKIKGHATQGLLACRCLNHNCRDAVVMEARLWNKSTVCTYPTVLGKYRDCNTEMLRMSEQDASENPYSGLNEKEKPHVWTYNVKTDENWFWKARGSRKATRMISSGLEYEAFKSIDFKEIIRSFWKQKDKDEFYFRGNEKLPAEEDAYDVFLDRDSEECGKLFVYSARSTRHRSSGADEISVGINEGSYLTPRASEISVTDMVIAVGTAFAALSTAIGVWTYLQKEELYDASGLPRRRVKWPQVSVYLFVLLIAIGGELMVLVYAFQLQNRALNWISFFVGYATSVALPQSVEDCINYIEEKDVPDALKCSQAGGVFTATVQIGTAWYFQETRWMWIIMLCIIIIILLACAAILISLAIKFRRYAYQRKLSRENTPDNSIDQNVNI